MPLVVALEILVVVLTYALLDSFDPCIYTLFALILSSSILIDVKYAARNGGAYIIALYIGYVIFGVLLKYLAVRVPTHMLAIVMFMYGFFTLATSARRPQSNELVCREDELPCRVASALRLNKLVNKSALSAFVLGILSSFALLPCSAGFYIAYNIVTKNYEFSTWILLTLLYVAIFVSPLVLIYIAMVFISKLKFAYGLILRNERAIKVAGSLIMISTAVYILTQASTFSVH